MAQQASQTGLATCLDTSLIADRDGAVCCIAPPLLFDIGYGRSMVCSWDGAGTGDTMLRILAKIRYLLDTICNVVGHIFEPEHRQMWSIERRDGPWLGVWVDLGLRSTNISAGIVRYKLALGQSQQQPAHQEPYRRCEPPACYAHAPL